MQKQIKLFAILLLIGVMSGIINSCKKPTEGISPIISFNYSEFTASFQFVDAVTGEPIGFSNSNEKVTVTIEGDDKSLIRDNIGSTSITPSKGFLTLAVKKDVKPTSSNPINFHVVAHANGYLSTSQPVEIRTKGTQHFVVYMVKINNTPEGVAAIVNSNLSSNSSGVVSSAFVLQTPDAETNSEKVKAKVTVPQGTTLLDKNMQPVTGTITTTMVHFNNQDEASLKSFPGGFAANTTNQGDIFFKTGGFVALEMKNGSGKEVKNFSTPISMNIQIPANTTNFDGMPIQDGMSIPIWSYDPDLGEWTKESDATIYFNSSTGKFEVDFEMSHLSYWNLDWYENRCTTGATVNISSNVSNTYFGYSKLKYPNGQLLSSSNINIKNGTSFSFLYSPLNQSVTLEVYKKYNSSTPLQTLSIANICSGNYSLDVQLEPNPTVNLTVNATCANKPNQIIRPSGSIYADSGYDGLEYVGEMIDGQISTNILEFGLTYSFYLYIGGEFISAPNSYTINETSYTYDEQLSVSICNMID